MTLLEAFIHIKDIADKYSNGNVKNTIEYMEKSFDRLSDQSKESLYHYREWKQRMDAWLEYVK
jgi:hypothetical protein